MQENINSPNTCEGCGHSNTSEAIYCRRCGQALKLLEATTRTLEGHVEDNKSTLQLNSQSEDSPKPSQNGGTQNISPATASESDIPTQQLNPLEGPVIPAEGTTVPMQPIQIAPTGPIESQAILRAMPILQYLARKKSDEFGPIFENYHFIFILHFLADLIGFIEAFQMMGMSWERSHFLYKPYLYPYKDRIAKQLADQGADVIALTPNTLHTIVGNIVAESRNDGRKIIIVEDGGYVVPLVHRTFIDDINCFQGAVEQTTKGVNEDLKVAPLRFPLLSVANAQIKREKESPQIATAVWDNVRRLLFSSSRDLRNPTVLVVGYGSIGMNLAEYLRNNGAQVRVFDADPAKRQAAQDAGYKVSDNICQLIEKQHGLILIGATGTTSIGRNEILALDHDSMLVSASSDQREIGVQELRYLSVDYNGTPITDPRNGNRIGHTYRVAETNNEITLLAEGFPINFWNTESMPIRVSQVAMVPLFLSTVALIKRSAEIEVGEPNSEFVDQLIEEEDIYSRL